MAEKLRDGDQFPAMRVNTVAHGELNLPGDLKGRWAILLFYRGWW
jgi:alkyl hydroperoxide reductase subunit AhpC